MDLVKEWMQAWPVETYGPLLLVLGLAKAYCPPEPPEECGNSNSRLLNQKLHVTCRVCELPAAAKIVLF